MTARPFPPPGAGSGLPDAPFVVRYGRHGRNMVLGGAALALALAAIGMGAAASGALVHTAGPAAVRFFSCLFAATGLLLLASLPVTARARGYVVDANGVSRVDSSRERPGWSVPWTALQAVALSVTESQPRREQRGRPGRVGYRSGSVIAQSSQVVLRGTTFDDRYIQSHPAIGDNWRHGELWVELGPAKRFRTEAEDAVRRFAPNLYTGVVPVPAGSGRYDSTLSQKRDAWISPN